MESLYFDLLLGHLIGDFLLQPQKMAISKSQKGTIGLFNSLLHCTVYTLSVCLMVKIFSPLFMLLVFLSHWPIDRYGLAEKWLKLIGGRDLSTPYYSGTTYKEVSASTLIYFGFGTVVYTVVDNTIHLLLLRLIFGFYPF